MTINRRAFVAGGVAALGMATSLASQKSIARKNTDYDSLVVDGLDVSKLTSDYLGMLRKAGVHCLHKTISGDALSVGNIYHFVDQHSDEVTIARSTADIYRAKKANKISIVLGLQGSGQLEPILRKAGRYSALSGAIQSFHGLGLRIQGICYNTNNIFGGGNLNPRSPLTRAGRRLVEEIHKLNIVLDVGGHTGEQTSFDAIAMSKGVPVICSHTNMAALNPNVRAISDKLCEAIANTGGAIGITAIGDFHTRSANNFQQQGKRSPQATLKQHLDQYDHLKKLVGIDHVALGPDFLCGYEDSFLLDTEGSVRFPSEMVGDGQVQMVKGFEDITELGNVVNGLKERGWSKQELRQLLGENWLRVYRQVWGV